MMCFYTISPPFLHLQVMPAVDGNIWSLTFYNNVNACALFIPMMILFGEVPVIVSFEHLSRSENLFEISFT